MLALQALGAQLVELNAQQLEAMQLPESLLEAVQEAGSSTRNVKKRCS